MDEDREDYDSNDNIYEEDDGESYSTDAYKSKKHQLNDYDEPSEVDEDEEEEDEEAGENELRESGFIVDDEDENSGSDHTSRKLKKLERRKRREERRARKLLEKKGRYDEDSLDEEDLELLEENTGIKILPNKSHRRLKRGRERHSDNDDIPDNDNQNNRDILNDSHPNLPSEDSDNSLTGRNKEYSPKVYDSNIGDNDDLGLFDDDVIVNRSGRYSEFSEGDSRNDKSSSRDKTYVHKDAMDDFIDNEFDGNRIRSRSSAQNGRQRSNQWESLSGSMGNIEGVDEDAMDDLLEIFGDGTEYSFALEGPIIEPENLAEEMLESVFEPSELKEKMMTSRDEEIRTTDMPERIQERGGYEDSLKRSLTDEEIEEETSFIIRFFTKNQDNPQFIGPSSSIIEHERFISSVIAVLKLISQDFMEVPFIFTHRKDVFITSDATGNLQEPRVWLREIDLWLIYDLDTQFRTFLSRRASLMSQVARVVDAGEWSDSDKEFLVQLLESASGLEDLVDLEDWVQNNFESILKIVRTENNLYKRPVHLNSLDGIKKSFIEDFVLNHVGITSMEFGRNIIGIGRYFIDDRSRLVSPEKSIKNFMNESQINLGLIEALNSAELAFAANISADPNVRKYLRNNLSHELFIRVRPTNKGMIEINGRDHPYFPFKFLKPKPISAFSNSAQFLQILKAESEGLIRFGFTLNSSNFSENDPNLSKLGADEEDFLWKEESKMLLEGVLKPMEIHMCSDSVHEAAEKWNSFRKSSLKKALEISLIPMMKKYFHDKLKVESENYISKLCSEELYRQLNVQPLRTSRMSNNDTPRVVVVVGNGFSTDNQGSVRIVFIDDHGRYVEHKISDTLREASEFSRSLYNGSEDLRLILEKRQPDVVSVVGMTPSTLRLFEDVKRITDNHSAITSDEIFVTLASDDLARIYYTSERAKSQFPTLGPAERYAMCVGRCLQDALSEYTSMGKELLGLSLHPLQRLVPSDTRWRHLERILISMTNSVGVNMNEIIQHSHKSPSLSYVCGLGPRKAQAILNSLSGSAGTSLIDSRSDLIYRELVTRNVFVNCASFLRIWPSHTDILDSTRIHPEDYELARKMAADALDVEDDTNEFSDSDNEGKYSRKKKNREGPSKYVSEVIRRSPEKLDELILSEYALELERRLGVPKLCCLQFIKHELQNPYEDHRLKFNSPELPSLFEMFSGETLGDTIRDDGTSIVVARVSRVKEKFAIAKLDNGIDAFIGISNIDDMRIDDINDFLYVGMPITGVIKKIDFEKMSVDMSIKPSDLENAKKVIESPPSDFFDQYYDFDAEKVAKTKSRLDQQRNQSLQRTIAHPLFRPFNSRQAERYLLQRSVGDCVIRPSSLGMDHLVITWKIASGLYQHIDVLELDKPSEMALGRILKIRDTQYGDLDELLAMYIEPLSRRFDEVRRCPKFYNPDRDPAYASSNNRISSKKSELPLADSDSAEPEPSDPNESLTQQLERQERHRNRCRVRIERYLNNMSQVSGRGSYCLALNYENPGTIYFYFKANPKSEGIMKWLVRLRPNEYLLGEKGRYPNVSSLINGFKTIAANSPQTQTHTHKSRILTSNWNQKSSDFTDSISGRDYDFGSNKNGGGIPSGNIPPPPPRSPNKAYH
ncbi:Transcription elongation factor spt6 [Smittium mucronatum]|uniref:Transcription elongation factor spt6 n=1 Tax=Smittium mucronatum TaxID=133383 RepID=A0A1R0GYI5_9FUNG|nr:Transcription elongation factor spt6 [Smittium mucronatum]